MTKRIRVENADTSSYKVRVHMENLVNGAWVRDESFTLDYPTELKDFYVHSTRRLVVEEGDQ